MIVRRLNEKDAKAWQDLRLRSLKEAPEAFLSSYEAEIDKSLDTVVNLFATSLTFGAFVDGQMVGQLTARPDADPRMAHRVWIGAVFVMKNHRATGAAQGLLDAAIEAATAAGHLQLELYVAVDNPRAIAFYKRNGFKQLGVVPRAVRGRNGFEDDLYMVRRLDSAEGAQ